MDLQQEFQHIRPISSVSSPNTTISNILELDLKRKASTELAETLKKTKVDPKAQVEGPAKQQTTLTLPQKY